ncbi:ubiquitin-like protein Pup [Patescibacteria group bacterium]|nr:MAG: ubiquitin-like protein Pup [Patescibacteria group bacterium]
MSGQANKNKTIIVKKEEQRPVEANKETIKSGKKTVKDADDLIDKIDDVLEENSEEFVKNYVQKGGE